MLLSASSVSEMFRLKRGRMPRIEAPRYPMTAKNPQSCLIRRQLVCKPRLVFPLLRQQLWQPFNYQTPLRSFSSQTQKHQTILSVMTPTVTKQGRAADDDKIYFQLHSRLERDAFEKVLAIFRDYKKEGIMSFDWGREMWKMDAACVQQDQTLPSTLRTRFLNETGVYLRPFPGEQEGADNANNKDQSSSVLSRSDMNRAIQSIVLDQAKSVAIDTQDKAFLVVTPTQQSSIFDYDQNNFDNEMKKECNKIDLILKHDLSGVTDHIEHSFVFAKVGRVKGQVYQTYDVFLVAELMQLLADKVPNVNIFVSEAAQEVLDERFTARQQQRQPIPAVEQVRAAHVPLHPHQMEGVRFFMENKGRGLLGDEMGLGKTMTALAYLASCQKRALVVTQKRVMEHWACEAETSFGDYFHNQVVILGAHIKKGQAEEILSSLSGARLVCVNYESLERFLPMIRQARLDTVILDESHSIKNASAKRTQLLLACRDNFEHRVLLSGTPIKNRAEEFVTQLNFLGLEDADDIASMPPGKLWNLLQKTKLYLRRDMKTELPHLRFKDPEIVEANDAPDSLRGFESGFEVKMLDSKGKESIREIVTKSLFETALFKVNFSAALAKKLTSHHEDDKIIIMSERVACAEAIYKALEGHGIGDQAVLHHGRLPDSERASIMESFSHSGAGSPRILVSTRPSIGVGLNLQCANRVIFNDLAWTPADILQAAARTKRLNQRKEVFEYWILADTNFDCNLVQILQRKLQLMRLYGEGKNISEEDQKWMNERVTFKDIYFGMKSETTLPLDQTA